MNMEKMYYIMPARILLIFYGIAYNQGFTLDGFMEFCHGVKEMFKQSNAVVAMPDYNNITETIRTDSNTFGLKPNGYIIVNGNAIRNFTLSKDVLQILNSSLDFQVANSAPSVNF